MLQRLTERITLNDNFDEYDEEIYDDEYQDDDAPLGEVVLVLVVREILTVSHQRPAVLHFIGCLDGRDVVAVCQPLFLLHDHPDHAHVHALLSLSSHTYNQYGKKNRNKK